MKSLLLFCLLVCWAKPYHPAGKSLYLDDCDLETALRAVERQYGCSFTYVSQDVQYCTLHVHIRDAGLEEAIGTCLRGLPLEGVITDSVGGVHVSLRRTDLH